MALINLYGLQLSPACSYPSIYALTYCDDNTYVCVINQSLTNIANWLPYLPTYKYNFYTSLLAHLVAASSCSRNCEKRSEF